MLFMTYWRLNENLDPKIICKVADKLMKEGKYPPEGVELKAHYFGPSNWGVAVFEADSHEAAFKEVAIWRNECPGIFESVELSIAIPTTDTIKWVLEGF